MTDNADTPNILASFAATPVMNNVINRIETVAGGNGEGYTGDGAARFYA